jgi:uncharacterized protein (DUF2164 family)
VLLEEQYLLNFINESLTDVWGNKGVKEKLKAGRIQVLVTITENVIFLQRLYS